MNEGLNCKLRLKQDPFPGLPRSFGGGGGGSRSGRGRGDNRRRGWDVPPSNSWAGMMDQGFNHSAPQNFNINFNQPPPPPPPLAKPYPGY